MRTMEMANHWRAEPVDAAADAAAAASAAASAACTCSLFICCSWAAPNAAVHLHKPKSNSVHITRVSHATNCNSSFG